MSSHVNLSMPRRSTVCVALAVLLVGLGVAAQAQAQSQSNSGIRQTRLQPRSAAIGENLVYNGGPVVHGATTYAIYWGQPASWDPGYKAFINQFLRDVASDSATGHNVSTNIFALTAQYSDHQGPAQYRQSFGGAFDDTDPLGALPCPSGSPAASCLLDFQIAHELESFTAAHHLPGGLHAIYFIFTPSGVISETNEQSSCAFHGVAGSSTRYLYSFNAYLANQPQCLFGALFQPNHSTAEATLPGVAHEIAEITTDPLGVPGVDRSAWRDTLGAANEMADACGGGVPVPGVPRLGAYDQTINGHKYFLFPVWSNLDGKCMFELLRHYAVPKLNGKALGKARRLLVGAHLLAGAITKRYSPRVPPGLVIGQQPRPGSKLAAGRRVDLTVSTRQRSTSPPGGGHKFTAGAYSGATAQVHGILLTVTGRRVRLISWRENVSCTGGEGNVYLDGFFHGRIDKAGRFATTDTSDGLVKITGVLKGKTASGTLSDTFHPSFGAATNVCRTGTVHWSATTP